MRRAYARTSCVTGQLLALCDAGRQFRLSIVHAEYDVPRRLVRGQTARQHSHDVYHVVFYTRGEAQILLRDQRVEVRRGAFVLTAPGEAHEFGPLAPAELRYHEVTFELLSEKSVLRAPFHELFSRYTGMELAAVAFPSFLDERRSRQADALFETLLERLNGSLGRALYSAEATLLEIFTFLIREIYDRQAASVETDPLLKGRAAIEQRYAETFELGDLARELDLSASYLCRAFKKRFDVSPIAYQHELRIRAAKNLLLTTSLPCKEIAARLGFCDIYTFSKAFKRAVGASPTHFAGTENLAQRRKDGKERK